MLKVSHAAAALLLASAVGAGEVRLDNSYLASGEKTKGVALLNLPAALPQEALVRISVVREIDVPLDAKAPAGSSTQVLLEQPASAQAGRTEVPFEVAAAGMLCGRLHVKAEVLARKDGPAEAVVWSAPLQVGVRRHIDLAGQWAVTNVEPLQGLNDPPKGWKPPPNVKTLTFPGRIDSALTQWFRGWVTVRREISWPVPENAADKQEGLLATLQPRFLRVSGVWDSVLATVDGVKVGEVMPAEELECLSHWPEFHGGLKGPENRSKLLMKQGHGEYPGLTWPLPKLLNPAGQAVVEMKLRGTSDIYSIPSYGIYGDLHFELAPAVCLQTVSFDTDKSLVDDKPGAIRRFTFKLTLANATGREFRGKLRTVYGLYAGPRSYTGPCPAYAVDEQPLTVPAAGGECEVVREEQPRFATCRATFVLLSGDGAVLDAVAQDFHTVTVEIRNQREIWLNNDRFIIKGRGSSSDDPHKRWQLRVNGVNVIRGPIDPAHIEDLLANGLLSSDGPLVASCEKCAFWNPKDTSNITRCVRNIVRVQGHLPGIIEWEATNELYGEPDECRIALAEAFHKLDPYHRPVLATKSGGEWEAVAKDGRVAGVDVVGAQYLVSHEVVESFTAAITEHPLICSEVVWNDGGFRQNMWQFWLEHGLSGALLFDYSGHSTEQAVPLTPPPDSEKNAELIRQSDRDLYQDLVANAARRADGRVAVTIGNRMPYSLRQVSLSLRNLAQFNLGDMPPGEAVEVLLPAQSSPPENELVALRADYLTHGGLPHIALLTARVTRAAPEGGQQ